MELAATGRCYPKMNSNNVSRYQCQNLHFAAEIKSY